MIGLATPGEERTEDPAAAAHGTRFLVYPQPPAPDARFAPEVIRISLPPERLGPGPSDHRMYVADARHKRIPYDEPPNLPPFRGEEMPPVEPGPDGHFDHLVPGSRAFGAAHMYAVARRVLDIWQHYFGRPVPWHFREDLERLELVPWLDWDNAQAGYGFIETGYRLDRHGERVPLCLNFDVVAHELGHSLLYSELGVPLDGAASVHYLAFHESLSDLVAIVASLHFESVIAGVLERTHGNLHLYNVANRIGELGMGQQIRLASNGLRMADVPSPDSPVEDLGYPEIHRAGEPLTGALFDILGELFQQILVREGLIGPALERLPLRTARSIEQLQAAQRGYDAAWAAHPEAFEAALAETRDSLGALLAHALGMLDWQLRLEDLPRALLEAESTLFGGAYAAIVDESFAWRGL